MSLILKFKILITILFCFSSKFGLIAQLNSFIKVVGTHSFVFEQTTNIDTMGTDAFLVGGTMSRPLSNTNNQAIHYDSYLIKNNISGQTNWKKKYSLGTLGLAIQDFKVLKNKDILIGGSSSIPNVGVIKDGILILADSNGYVKSSSFYPGQEICKILRLKNDNIAILSSDSGKYLKVTLLNPSSNVLWCKRIVQPMFTWFSSISEGGNNKIIIASTSLNNAQSNLLLLDSLGNKINDLRTNSPTSDFFYQTYSTFDNTFYVVGTKYILSSSILVGSIFKLDHNLNLIWNKYYIPDSSVAAEFFAISAFNKNSLVIAAEPEVKGCKTNQIFLDSMGNIKRSHYYVADSTNLFTTSVITMKNSKILFCTNSGTNLYGFSDTLNHNFCGYTNLHYNLVSEPNTFSWNNLNLINSAFTNSYSINVTVYFDPFPVDYLCSTGPNDPPDPFDQVGVSKQSKNDEENEITLFPNPSSNEVFIKKSQHELRSTFYGAQFEIANSVSKKIQSFIVRNSDSLVRLDLSSFEEGVYFLSIKLINGDEIHKKIIVNRD